MARKILPSAGVHFSVTTHTVLKLNQKVCRIRSTSRSRKEGATLVEAVATMQTGGSVGVLKLLNMTGIHRL